MRKVANLHEEIFKFLYDEHLKSKESFFFTMRRTNRFRRLDEGYWFHGNDDYIAISFWSGFDYANKTPNISFIIYPEWGTTKLELTAIDSEIKFKFLQERVAENSQEFNHVKRWRLDKVYDIKDPLESLESFLENDKKKIDLAVSSKENFTKNEDPVHQIGFIKQGDFNFNLRRILKRRDEIEDYLPKRIPVTLKSVFIKDFGPIQNKSMENLDEYTQFIFLTGENGGGKTSVLRAISLAMTNDHERMLHGDDRYNVDSGHYDVEVTVRQGYRTRKNHAKASSEKRAPIILGNGFAAYGPHRLVTSESFRGHVGDLDSSSMTKSIFDDDGFLLDVWDTIGEWTRNRNSKRSQRILDSIKTTLHDLNDKLKVIYFPHEIISNDRYKTTLYQEQDEEGNAFPPVEFRKLASGSRNLIAMFGDMMLRLLNQQLEVEEIADLKGIVIIDEIDLHLHPKLQKKIVEQLRGTFPKIQFIISTHSPVPLLGAPSQSKIFNVSRKHKEGVVIKEIKGIDFQNLLPNTILTSPIFGMDSLTPFGNIDAEKINVDNDYNETLLMNLVDEKIDDLFESGNWGDKKLFKNKEDDFEK